MGRSRSSFLDNYSFDGLRLSGGWTFVRLFEVVMGF